MMEIHFVNGHEVNCAGKNFTILRLEGEKSAGSKTKAAPEVRQK